MFKVNNKDNIDAVLMLLLLTLNIFHTFFAVSIVDFEQVNFNRIMFMRNCQDDKTTC